MQRLRIGNQVVPLLVNQDDWSIGNDFVNKTLVSLAAGKQRSGPLLPANRLRVRVLLRELPKRLLDFFFAERLWKKQRTSFWKSVPEALEAGTRLGVEIIPGVEISSRFEEKEIHILGYFLKWQDPELQKCLAFKQIYVLVLFSENFWGD